MASSRIFSGEAWQRPSKSLLAFQSKIATSDEIDVLFSEVMAACLSLEGSLDINVGPALVLALDIHRRKVCVDVSAEGWRAEVRVCTNDKHFTGRLT